MLWLPANGEGDGSSAAAHKWHFFGCVGIWDHINGIKFWVWRKANPLVSNWPVWGMKRTATDNNMFGSSFSPWCMWNFGMMHVKLLHVFEKSCRFHFQMHSASTNQLCWVWHQETLFWNLLTWSSWSINDKFDESSSQKKMHAILIWGEQFVWMADARMAAIKLRPCHVISTTQFLSAIFAWSWFQLRTRTFIMKLLTMNTFKWRKCLCHGKSVFLEQTTNVSNPKRMFLFCWNNQFFNANEPTTLSWLVQKHSATKNTSFGITSKSSTLLSSMFFTTCKHQCDSIIVLLCLLLNFAESFFLTLEWHKHWQCVNVFPSNNAAATTDLTSSSMHKMSNQPLIFLLSFCSECLWWFVFFLFFNGKHKWPHNTDDRLTSTACTTKLALVQSTSQWTPSASHDSFFGENWHWFGYKCFFGRMCGAWPTNAFHQRLHIERTQMHVMSNVSVPNMTIWRENSSEKMHQWSES